MSTQVHAEVERKYDVAEPAALPELHRLPGVRRVAQPVEHHLEATYFDTAALVLARAGITLRRRTGGEDAGWHLKLPVGEDERRELRRPLEQASGGPEGAGADGTAEAGDGLPPAALFDLVAAHLRGDEVVPVARLRTRRVVHRLLGDDDRVLAEVCDDHVAAAPREGLGARQEWREWEVELVTGPRELLDAAGQALEDAGGRRAAVGSKLSRTLADALAAAPGPGEEAAGGRRLSAGRHARHALRRHLARLEHEDGRVRLDEEDSVHQMRVAIRRLRAGLATYRPLLDAPRARALREELTWLGLVLGKGRDAEVMRARLLALVAAEPPELVMGRVTRRIDDELRGGYARGRVDILEALRDERYFRLLDGLDALLAPVPDRGEASEPAATVLPGLLRRDWKRLRRAAHTVARATDPASRDTALHEVRKAAKRLRYGAESAVPVLGEAATALAAAAEGLQDLLGEHQDSVVARETLRQMGIRAFLDGDNAFTFGRLHALEQARAQGVDKPYARALGALSRARLPGWPKVAGAPKAPRSPTA